MYTIKKQGSSKIKRVVLWWRIVGKRTVNIEMGRVACLSASILRHACVCATVFIFDGRYCQQADAITNLVRNDAQMGEDRPVVVQPFEAQRQVALRGVAGQLDAVARVRLIIE